MSITEKIVVTALLLISFAAFQYAGRVNYYFSRLDSAMMVENINSTFSEGAPQSQINSSAIKAIDTVITEGADQVCSQPLKVTHPESIAMFKRHAYGILYVMAPLRAIASGSAIAASFHAAAFVGLLFAVYIFLRIEQLSIFAALLFCSLVLVHPAWSESAFGQFYPDRFFMPAGFIYAVLLYRRLTGKAEHTLAIILIAILASAITERAAIMIGGFTLTSLILFHGWWRCSRKDLPLLGIAAVSLIYALYYMGVLQNNPDYGSFTSQASSFLGNISSNETFRLNLEKYLWVCFPYLILAIFEWRLAFIALGAMLPNIIGSIGGAEKTGWSTHYHSMYFPFLIAAASIGFLLLWRHIEKYWVKWPASCLLVTTVVYLLMLNPYTLSPFWDFKWVNAQNNAIFKVEGILTNTGTGASIRIYSDLARKVASAVPDRVAVTTTEGMMPALLGHGRILHYYPLGLASADYAVLGFSRDSEGKIQFSGAVTYLGNKNLAALDECLNARIKSEGYELEKTFSPGSVKDQGMAILKRISKG